MNPGQPVLRRESRFVRSRKAQLVCFGLIAVAILGLILHSARNRRGEAAWKQYYLQLEAKGEILDWEAFIPPEIPDEQNFFKAPGMTTWFSMPSRRSNNVAFFTLPVWVTNRHITLEQLRTMPERADPSPRGAASSVSRERLREWFAQHEAEYRLLVEASARPLARWDTDYRVPILWQLDTPYGFEFIGVAYTLAAHANLSVLDGKGDVVVEDLSLLRRLADVSAGIPNLQGVINSCVILGRYLQTARDALESGVLTEAQLRAIQEQLRDVNLLQVCAQTLRSERAYLMSWLSLPPSELIKAWDISSSPPKPFWKFKYADWSRFNWKAWYERRRLKMHLSSRSWMATNLILVCRSAQNALDQMDLSRQRMHGKTYSVARAEFKQTLQSAGSSALIPATMLPDYFDCVAATASYQTQLDQLRVACALERYRLAHAIYPEQLDTLIPAYLDHLPKDLFSDGPLKYRRDERGGFRLWSVGWDEKDDDGVASKPAYRPGPGDWVWQRSP